MNKRTYPTLINAAESITRNELCMAPELSTLAALDATLLAATNLLEFNHFYLSEMIPENDSIPYGVDEHLVESICILAKALRKNLAAYYASIHESCQEHTSNDDISF